MFRLKKDICFQRGWLRRFLIIKLIVVCFLFSYAFKKPNTSKSLFKVFRDCVHPRLLPLKDKYTEFYFSFTNIVRECDILQEYQSLDVRTTPNRDEVKYVVLPRKNETLTMVTLGIGQDIKAEIKLNELYPNIEFYGSDPSSIVNKDLYENKLGGKFYKYAISGERGMKNSRVFQETRRYKEEITEHVGAEYFLKYFVKRSRIDIFWIDVEGNEFSFLDQVHNGGTIDKEGIKICQMNVEIHNALLETGEKEKEKFHDFIFKVLEDEKYIFMKPNFIDVEKYRFIRLFLVNVGDEECVKLYVKE